MNTVVSVVSSCVSLADKLGSVRREIERLEQIEKELRSEIIESGEQIVDGDSFLAKVSVYQRSTVNWKAIAEKFNPSRQMIAGNTTTVDVVKITCSEK